MNAACGLLVQSAALAPSLASQTGESPLRCKARLTHNLKIDAISETIGREPRQNGNNPQLSLPVLAAFSDFWPGKLGPKPDRG